MPSFASLPEGHVSTLPVVAPPARVAGSEKVDGFAPTPMPTAQAAMMRRGNPDMRFSYLFGDAAQARNFLHSGDSRQPEVDACLTDGGNTEALARTRGDGEDEAQRDWQLSFRSMLSFNYETNPSPPTGRGKHAGGGEVHAVHAERFVAGSEGHPAALEITDAWFDVRTRGVRLLGRTSVPLSRVFVGPNGLEVYAARDGNALQVVVHAADHVADDPALARLLHSELRSMFATLPDNNNGNTDCGHLRMTLRASAGGGQMATLQANAFLPPVDGDWGKAEEGESDDSRGARLLQAMRQRPYQLSVSTTSTSSDPAPVVSIALGWVGRERTVR
jgi:hypothetical protein